MGYHITLGEIPDLAISNLRINPRIAVISIDIKKGREWPLVFARTGYRRPVLELALFLWTCFGVAPAVCHWV